MYRGSLTPEQQERVLSLNRKGMGYKRIAESTGLTYAKVRHYLESVAQENIEEAQETGPVDLPDLPVVVFDLETTDLNTFFGRLIIASFLDMSTKELETRTIHDFAGSTDKKETQLLGWATERYESAFILIGQNITAFDRHFLQGRHDQLETGYVIRPALHYDTKQIAQYQAKIRPQGYSLKNLLDYYSLPISKDEPSKHVWARSKELDEEAIERLKVRCELDVLGTALVAGKLLAHVKRGPGIKSIR